LANSNLLSPGVSAGNPEKNIMTRTLLIVATFFFTATSSTAQTLFTYGKHSVDAKEFLRAYNKNNTQPVRNKAKSPPDRVIPVHTGTGGRAAISDYLELYIKSRLKIQEAYERRYDTLPHLKMELANLRTQVTENYLTDPEMMPRLIKEAFQRSQKDVNTAHIFISFRNAVGLMDTASASKKRDEVLHRLQKGEDFRQVARKSSDDTTAKNNGGDLGFITVFTLPYEFESAIYNTAVGRYSAVVKSKNGYHLFKNLGERKAAGKIKAQQILLAFSPGEDDAAKKQMALRADSLYKRIMAGDNFARLAADFSNDYVTAASSGMMPDISVGQYDPAFEKMLWSLAKNGAVSKPFLTSHGWHIVKRISLKPVITDANNKAYQDELKQKIAADSRSKNSRDFIYQKVIAKKGYKKFPYDDGALWNMTDSVLDQKPMKSGWAITAYTPLFAIGDSVYHANHWVNFAYTYRFKQDGSGAKPWEQLREEWVQHSLFEYYKEHLGEFAPEFAYQMTELKDGNLFFEIMQQEVWNKAQADTAGLLSLYEKNKMNYRWKQSADAVLFFCSDMNTARAVYDRVKAAPSDWEKTADMYSEKVVTDSSRYEWEQLPNLNKMLPRPGMFTTPQLNATDNTASFAYIIRVYNQPTQRSFPEARGLVISDYQTVLEQQWDEALRKKYPVVIDWKVLDQISKQ